MEAQRPENQSQPAAQPAAETIQSRPAEGASQAQPAARPRAASSKDRWVKLGFLAVAIIACVLIWMSQRKDPELKGSWTSNLAAAQQQAAAQPDKAKARVLIFFTNSPMSEQDKQAVKTIINSWKTQTAMKAINSVNVHLTLAGNPQEAEKYKVKAVPAYVLLDGNGKPLLMDASSQPVLNRSGPMNDITFCREVLQHSVNQE